MALSDVKQGVKDALAAVATTFDHMPATLTPPALIVTEADPWITEGQTFNEKRVNLLVLLLVAPGTNTVMVKALTDLLEGCYVALSEKDWNFGNVERPSLETINGINYLATSLEINTTWKETV